MAQKESKKIIHRKIKEYIKILQENGIGVWRLYLFGSYAKDRFTPESDIDLAIFLDTDNVDGFLEDVKLMHLRRKVGSNGKTYPAGSETVDSSLHRTII